jgi:multicomponent Na+:H+ antiporter subunit F
MILAVLAFTAVILSFTFLRLLAGPTLYDRVIAANAIVVEVALICSGLAVWAPSARLADVAIGLVLCLLVLNVAALKFFSTHTFQPPLDRAGDSGA